jgi:phytoene desaturase
LKPSAIVIGSGFSGLATASSLAQQGYQVTILEKNSGNGGRARMFQAEGFTFDMGPSWYWMPDVFEDYFARFGKKVSDYYQLERLDPSYRVVFQDKSTTDLPAGLEPLKALFEQMEPGCGPGFDQFIAEAKYKYEVGLGEFVWKPSHGISEFFDPKIVTSALRLDLLKSMAKHARKFFKNPKILEIIEFPVLFLGATPQNTPALYSLMNYAEMAMGTWYPMGGMYKIIEGMVSLAKELGVSILNNQEVTSFYLENGLCKSVQTTTDTFTADVIVASADYRHMDKLLGSQANHSDKYWESRTMAPSSLLFYLGINGRINKLQHHNLFFDEDFAQHAYEIYTQPQWPSKPLFYASAPSVTDPSVAPEGHENLFLLMPVAPGLQDDPSLHDKYFGIIMDRLEAYTGMPIREHIVYKRSYAHANFEQDYHAFKGNAYGLANTLMQTAFLKPKLKHKKIENFYYTGQLTVPGPGVPPSLISGLVVANEITKNIKISAKIKQNSSISV